ncbi:MAG: ABC-F family ATP-binding cassette domain-containing protein [Chloroflexota bacterium]
MSILTASRVGKSFGADDIFGGITVEIPHGARVAMVGPNGAGKTTLLRLLIRADEPTTGTVQHMRGLTIGFLPQRPELLGERTLWDEMLTAFKHFQRAEIELADLAHKMADTSRPDYDEIMERYGHLQEEFERTGGYDYETRIRQVLQGLGFDSDDYQKPLTILSGGQKTRAFLARLLLQSPALLVLDEPTNHLDINAVEWLEAFLNSWKGSVLVVSHDRYFMDHVASTIWELDWGHIEVYNGNYSHYVRQREDRHAAHWAEFEAQQERIAKEEEYIRRNMAGQNTRQAQGRLKRLDRLKRDELISRPHEARALHIKLQTSIRSGDKVLITKDLTIGYHDDRVPLFTVPDLTLYRGEVAAVIGPNGVGKTTFIKTLLGQLEPLKGSSRLGAQVKLGYFAQAHELLNATNSILDELLTVKNMPISQARAYLAPYLFTGDDVFRPISTLSGGERGRVALAKLALDGANFLLLDEPTNHLDIPAQEVLQAVLSEFNGTILLISHDRYLIDALATQIWATRPGQMVVFEGSYQEYIAARDGKAVAATAHAAKAALTASPSTPKKDQRDQNNGKAAARSALKPTLSSREREKRTAAIEAQIHALELKLVELSGDLGAASEAGKVDQVRELGEAYAAAEAELEAMMNEWETLLA